MSISPHDWHGVALARLTAVMGDSGPSIARGVLAEIGMERLESAADLRQFANALTRRGGFASAVGAMLGLHAAMYDALPSTPPAAGAALER